MQLNSSRSYISSSLDSAVKLDSPKLTHDFDHFRGERGSYIIKTNSLTGVTSIVLLTVRSPVTVQFLGVFSPSDVAADIFSYLSQTTFRGVARILKKGGQNWSNASLMRAKQPRLR